jgi:RNA recognition motif-containing protein
VKIENIPLLISINNIEKAFHSDLHERIHIPTDNLNNHCGIAFLTFKSVSSCQQFINNLSCPGKFLFLGYD